MPINTLSGTWSRLLTTERLRRSSHVLSVVDQRVFIFGGEVQPRQPVDNEVDIISLTSGMPNSLSQASPVTYQSESPRLETKRVASAPQPRVGSSSAVLNGNVYMFSGRGGVDMAPIEEKGALWSFDPAKSTWQKVEPANPSAPYPPARSYHCTASDGRNNIFVHAGCPAKGRLSDLWKFDISTRSWAQLPDAPPPPRGGSSIAYSNAHLYRMNGFDGQTEQGGSIDIFDISANSWTTESYTADGNDGPEPRSVCTLLPIKLLRKDKLITLFGERDPSSSGHAGAGKMLSDVWLYDIVENWWTKLDVKHIDGVPSPRGWFDADVIIDEDEEGLSNIILHGGLDENNERLADLWLLKF